MTSYIVKEVNDTDIIYDINTIAYTIYLKYCRRGGYGIVSFENFSKYDHDNEFHDKAKIMIRNNKINKIFNK